MEPLNLTPEQLEAYTGKSRPKAQARVLEAVGVPYRRRPDGSLIVLRVHVDSQPNSRAKPRFVPDWKALAEVTKP